MPAGNTIPVGRGSWVRMGSVSRPGLVSSLRGGQRGCGSSTRGPSLLRRGTSRPHVFCPRDTGPCGWLRLGCQRAPGSSRTPLRAGTTERTRKVPWR